MRKIGLVSLIAGGALLAGALAGGMILAGMTVGGMPDMVAPSPFPEQHRDAGADPDISDPRLAPYPDMHPYPETGGNAPQAHESWLDRQFSDLDQPAWPFGRDEWSGNPDGTAPYWRDEQRGRSDRWEDYPPSPVAPGEAAPEDAGEGRIREPSRQRPWQGDDAGRPDAATDAARRARSAAQDVIDAERDGNDRQTKE